MEFRLLEADDIECRISTCSQYGVSLLLYKNARVDMNLLDSTVGEFNWQREHKELKGNIYCGVSIYDKEKDAWATKWDCGKESYTDSEKGEASDSFKRACFNWGIGRELYTAPQMYVFSKDLNTLKETNGKWTCKDFFEVEEVEYNDRRICYVKVLNTKNGKYIEFGTPAKDEKKKQDVSKMCIDAKKVKALENRCKEDGVDVATILRLYKVNALDELTELKHANINAHWEEIRGMK